MFIKIGDLSPITIVDPVDVSNESTKKALKKAVKTVKDSQKVIPAPAQKESEKK